MSPSGIQCIYNPAYHNKINDTILIVAIDRNAQGGQTIFGSISGNIQESDYDNNIASQGILVRSNGIPLAVAFVTPSASEGDRVVLDGSKRYDPDGYPRALSYKWVQTRGVPVTIIDGSSAIASFVAPHINATQQLGFQLTVSDGQYSSTSDVYITLTMSVQNIPPVAEITSVLQSTKGAQVILDGSNSFDPDYSPNQLSYRWTQVGGAQIKIQDTNSPITSFISPASDSGWPLQFELLVNDGASSSKDTVTITLKKEPQIEIAYIIIPIAAGGGFIALKVLRGSKKDEPSSNPGAASVRYETKTGFEQ